MGTSENDTIDENDRIVEINGIALCVHDNYNPKRWNIICESNKLKSYIKTNNLIQGNDEMIGKNLHMFNDIKIVSVKGFY